MDALVEQGYTHCFYVGGGNILHLLESARTRVTCIAVINEVTAGIAAEYFNVANRENNHRAFVLVTAGPGLTNLVTAISGAWLESRELLVVGGQARSDSLGLGKVRQLGHQEVDGVSIVNSTTKAAILVNSQLNRSGIFYYANLTKEGRKGPVFLEVCLDISAQEVKVAKESPNSTNLKKIEVSSEIFIEILQMIRQAERPLILIGAGVDFTLFNDLREKLHLLKIPIATSWNATDYLEYDDAIYAGRPGAYGMRWANAVIQQSDLLLAIGTRMSFWETGFNYENFAPLAKIIHVDIDQFELEKETINKYLKINLDSNNFFSELINKLNPYDVNLEVSNWVIFIQEIKKLLPVNELQNEQFSENVNPFIAIEKIGSKLSREDKVIVCSSGGTYTAVMQSLKQQVGQLVTNNRGLASMGYGLAGAIGTSFANPNSNIILFEGDGGFAQNIGDLGTVAINKLNIKIFLFSNNGFASIRISQKTNFSGAYLGCDERTGIGLPNWIDLFTAYNIPSMSLTSNNSFNATFDKAFTSTGPYVFILSLNQEQTFLPKLASSTLPSGKIVSNPLHLMAPELPSSLADKVFKFLPKKLRSELHFSAKS